MEGGGKLILSIITIAVIMLAAAPQVQAQDMKKLEALEKEMDRLDKAVEKQGGKATPAQMKRAQEIQEEIIQQRKAEEEKRQREAAMYPGETRGWPAGSLYTSRFKLPAFKQPSRTNASYNARVQNKGEGDYVTFYITGATNAHFQDLKKQVEAAKPRSSGNYDATWFWASFTDPLDPDGKRFFTQISIQFKDGTIEFSIMSVGTKG